MTKREAANAEMHEAYKKSYADCTAREKKLRDCDIAWLRAVRQKLDASALTN
jgi:hypothetical protein